jgi:hypothetical protein
VKGKVSAQTDDPILKALESRGLLKGPISGKEGVWDITCPWLGEHTDRADSGAAYFQPGYGGRLAPGFKCHHGHCESRTVKDLLRLLKPDTAPSIEGELGKDTKKGKKGSVATKLVRIAERAISKLWHDAEMNPWATLQINGHQEHYPLRNKAVRRHLAGLYFHSEGQAAHSQGIQDALAVLEAKATFEGEQHAVYVRVASHEGKVYLDLANAKWQAVEIDAQEWRVVDKPPVRFWRPRGMLPLPDPKPGGSLANLKALLNVDDRGTMFATAWLIGALKPRGPYPILNIEGEAGTGKSTLCRKLRRLIDPHVALLRSPPREERDILIAGRNALVVGFDNLSGLPVWLSDALCRVSTGGGMSTRELYTDQDEVFFDVMRPIIVNGIDSIGTRSDYRDRSMWVLLHPLTDIHEEQDIWEGFEEQRPFILGALLYAVSAALRHWDTTKLSAKPRMADFARWIAAAEAGGALPWGAGEFVTAYLKFRDNQAREALSGDKVAEGLFLFMKQFQQWTGTIQALKKGVEFVAGAGKLGDTWPKTPKGLGSVLRRIAPDLRRAKVIDVSFDVLREQKTGKTQVRLTALENMCKTTSPSSLDDEKHPENGSTQWVEAGEDSSVPTSPKLHPSFTQTSPLEAVPQAAGEEGEDCEDDFPIHSSMAMTESDPVLTGELVEKLGLVERAKLLAEQARALEQKFLAEAAMECAAEARTYPICVGCRHYISVGLCNKSQVPALVAQAGYCRVKERL